MTTAESLAIIEASLADVGTSLAKLDQYKDLAASSQETVKELEDAISGLHANQDNLEQRTRANKLTSSSSLLQLEKADLAGLNREINLAADRVVEYGRSAIMLLQQLHSAILAARKKSAETLLRSAFDVRQLHMPVEVVVNAAFSVHQVVELGNTINQHRHLPVERDLAVYDARQLRERTAPLLAMADELDEPLYLITSKIAPLAEHNPAPATMSASLVTA